MITVETQPRGEGHRDDGHEEEIQWADNDTKRKTVTNKHHQRGESSKQGHAVLVRSEVERWRLTEFAKSSLLGARRKRARGVAHARGGAQAGGSDAANTGTAIGCKHPVHVECRSWSHTQ